jgi:hypothetical protein
MPRDQAKADQLASAHLDGADHRATFSAIALCGMRWAGSLGEAVALERRVREAAWTERLRVIGARGDVRALRRKAMHYPGQPFDLRAYVENLSRDLGYTILTAAIVEEELERLLLVYLGLDAEDAEGLAKWFDDRKPYNNFRGKIRGAYEHYAVIDDETHNDLLVIRDMRNAFAHTRERLDFNAPVIKELAKRVSGEGVKGTLGGYLTSASIRR